ncbi:MAG: tRNA (adenosine(37)-N6)-threonylcarbamoyltransferase complex dimerization subunit type 1 TsaB [Bradymonadaceae bacterium]|nr:tRNA (adenosine(37)-N6)-threonylcarbamoyltransferase complex dimerization subunit type 1 TsaB [Lujinxingiaceae bacterium]
MKAEPIPYRRVLAIEAATRIQSLALIDGEEVLEHRQQRVRFDHGSILVRNIDELFAAQNLSIHDVDLIVVGLGPGSFTGLRVAMAMAKALARAAEKPLVGVSSLAALAYSVAIVRPQATVCAMIDARRDEVYTGVYRLERDVLQTLDAEHTASPSSLGELLMARATSGPVFIAGNAQAAYPDLDIWREPFVQTLPGWTQTPSAIAAALLGRERAVHLGADDLVSLEPNYIRPSDAQLPRGASDTVVETP